MKFKSLYGLFGAIFFIALGLASYSNGGGETSTIIFFSLGILFFYAHHLHITFQEVINEERKRTTLNEEDIQKLIKEVGEMQKIQDGEEPAQEQTIPEGTYEVIDTQKEKIEVSEPEKQENVDKIE